MTVHIYRPQSLIKRPIPVKFGLQQISSAKAKITSNFLFVIVAIVEGSSTSFVQA